MAKDYTNFYIIMVIIVNADVKYCLLFDCQFWIIMITNPVLYYKV